MSAHDDEVPADGPGAPSDHRRRRTAWLAGGALVGLAGLVIVGYGLLALRLNWFPFHSAPPREVSLEEARRRFLEDRVDGDATAHPFTPAEGVYEYEGSGNESLSNPPRSQLEGPRVPGTVTHGPDGCWQFRLDYSTNHWRRWSFCANQDRLVEEGNEVSQRWDFGTFAVENLTTMRCEPPGVIMESGMVVGDKWATECQGENTQISGTTISTGTHRLVAVEPLRVGATKVEAYHFRDERMVSGAQSGTERFDFWLAADGLLLEGVQRISVDSDSPLGRVTYTQESSFSLVSLLP